MKIGTKGRTSAVNTSDNSNPATDFAFESIEDFLAHAFALELDVAERYEEMAHSLDVHNNAEVAELFHKLAEASRKHAAEMEAHCQGKKMPKIAPWDFKWGDGDAPETPSIDDTHYLMTPYHAIALAREAEFQAQQFYAKVSEEAGVALIKSMALEFAYEEAGHVELLDEWILKYPAPEKDWDYDPDPPGTPE